jgi:hypothetical protein
MAAPEFVPVLPEDLPRLTERMPPAESWFPDRPAEVFVRAEQPHGRAFGNPGPDQGYGLKLARRFEDRLQLAPGEDLEDAIAGCVGVGLKRASMFGRAPVIYDFELAFTLWGFLGGAPDDLIRFRSPLFASAKHHYWEQRQIVDRVPDDTLRLPPAIVAERLGEWPTLLTV